MAELREHTVLLHSSTIDAYSWLIWLAGGSWRLSPEGQWLEFERIRARLTQDARVHEWIEFQLDGTPYSPVERHLIAQHIDDQLSLRRLLRPWHQDLDPRDRSGAKALFDRLMADARVTKNVKEAVTKAARLHSDGFVPSRVRMESSWPLPAKVLDKYTRALNQRAQKQDAIRESSQRLQSLTHSLPSEEARDALDNIVGAISAYGNESHLRVLEELLPVLLKHLEFPEVQDALREIGEAFMRFGSPKIHPRRFVQALLPYLSTVAGQTVLDQFTLSAIRQQVMANREGSRQALVAVGLATPSAGNGDEAMRSQGESLIHLDDQHLSSLFSSMVLEIDYVTDASQMESYFENFVSQLPNAHMRALAISVMASAIGGSGKKRSSVC